MSGTLYEVDGFDELEEKLRHMGKEVGESADKATRTGALFVRGRQEANAPEKNITAIEKISSDNHSAIYHIGLIAKKWFYKFFEFGAQPHEIKGNPMRFYGESGFIQTEKVDHPGMAAQPFIKPSVKSKNRETAIQRMSTFFLNLIMRYLT